MGIIQRLAERVARGGGTAEQKDKLTQSIGVTGTAFYGGQIQSNEYNAELKGQKASSTYDKMRRSDAQVNAILSVVKLPIQAATWSVTVPDENDAVQEFLEEALFDRLNFQSLLRHALLMCDFGFELMEKVYVYDQGKMWLDKVSHRDQKTIWKWNVDENEDLESVTQQARKGSVYDTMDIPANKILLFTFNQEGNNFEGISLLRSAYKHWFIKDGIYRIDAIAHERFGIGVPYAKAPEGYTETQKDAVEALMKNYKAGDQSYLFILPEWEIGILGVQGTQRYDPLPSIRHHDEMISRSVLAQFLNLGTTGTGSYSLGDSMTDLYMFALKAIADQVKAEINQSVVRQLLDLNFGPNAEGEVTYADLDTTPPKEVAEMLKTLSDSKMLTYTPETEQHVRGIVDLPLLPEDEETDDDTQPEPGSPGVDDDDDVEAGGTNDRTGDATSRGGVTIVIASETAFDPTSPHRPLLPCEEVVSFAEIDTQLRTTRQRIVRAFSRFKDEWTTIITEQLDLALADGNPSDVADVRIPDELRAKIERAVKIELMGIYAYGFRSVRAEWQSTPNTMSGGRGSRYADDLLDLEEVEHLFVARARRFTARMAARSEGVAVDRALSVYRTKGEDFGQEDLAAIRDELDALADSTVEAEARQTVSEALNTGRMAAAKSLEEEIEYATYSAILDQNLCAECKRYDGQQFQVGTSDYRAAAPPNRACFGGGACRCVYVYTFRTEVQVQ